MNITLIRHRRITLCLLLLCLFETAISKNLQAEYGVDVKYVSIIALIGNPEKYDGDIVQVEGYVHIQFEGNAIYLHEEDYRKRLFSNSLYLDVYSIKGIDRSTLTDHYCRVEGTFHQPKGGIRSGTIDKIRYFEGYEI